MGIKSEPKSAPLYDGKHHYEVLRPRAVCKISSMGEALPWRKMTPSMSDERIRYSAKFGAILNLAALWTGRNRPWPSRHGSKMFNPMVHAWKGTVIEAFRRSWLQTIRPSSTKTRGMPNFPGKLGNARSKGVLCPESAI